MMIPVTKQASLAILALTAIGTFPSAAEAFGGRVANSGGDCGATCCYTVGSKVDTGDDYYGSHNWDWCRDDYLSNNSRVFGMREKYWGGHGWTEACDEDNPTGRMFTTMIALTETAPDKAWPDLDDIDGNILRWGGGWAARVHDDLRASCAYNGKTSFATTSYSSDSTTLWIPNNFYGDDSRLVVSRASTIIHEAGHLNGKRHTGDGNDGDNDPSVEYNGAWAKQAYWLGQYAREGVFAPDRQRCRAEDQANDILETWFDDLPDFGFDNVDDALCSSLGF